MDPKDIKQVRKTLQQFQDGYQQRDLDQLDTFLKLFVQKNEVELIGIGASERGGYEWFEGVEKIREVIQSDWEYWGAVEIDVMGAKINVLGDIAWLTTTGTLEQTDASGIALSFYLEQMKQILDDKDRNVDEKLVEATHFGMRRLRERLKGLGHKWPFVISAVLQRKEAQWRFHTIHWSMPVD